MYSSNVAHTRKQRITDVSRNGEALHSNHPTHVANSTFKRTEVSTEWRPRGYLARRYNSGAWTFGEDVPNRRRRIETKKNQFHALMGTGVTLTQFVVGLETG